MYKFVGRHGTFGRTVTTNVGYNTCGAGTIYDNTGVLPDLTDLSIPNEQKRWEEVQKIRTLPIPMAQKRELKTQLTVRFISICKINAVEIEKRITCRAAQSAFLTILFRLTFPIKMALLG